MSPTADNSFRFTVSASGVLVLRNQSRARALESTNQKPETVFLLCHLGYVQIESCLRQQRRQFECPEAVSGNFRVAIKTGFAVNGFMPSVEVIEELLRLAGFRHDGPWFRVTTASAA